jgi:transposase-like protein
MAKQRQESSKPWSTASAEKVLNRADSSSSGLSDEQFAKREGLNPQRLYYWRQKLGRGKGRAASKASQKPNAPRVRGRGDRGQPGFVEITTTLAAAVERIEIQLRNGRVVSAPMSVAPGRLAALLDALEGVGC